MSTKTQLTGRQVKDADGFVVEGCGNFDVDISGDVTATTIFTGKGVILRLIIWTDVDSGTFQLKDDDTVAIFPSGKTDYAGTFEIRRFLENGCNITTSGFTGGTMTVVYFK